MEATEAVNVEQRSIAVPLDSTREKSSALYSAIVPLLGPLAGLVIWVMPIDIDPNAKKAFAIAVFMAMYWITEPIDHAVTALIGCYLFWAVNAVSFPVAFSGFSSSTPWFLFGALLMGEASSRVGLSKRVGFFLLGRSTVSYSRLLFAVITLSFLLSFVIPSGIARIAATAPLLIGIIGAVGLNSRSNAARGLFIALTYSASLFDLMMMSGPTSILTRGIVEELSGAQILWSQWLIAFLPLSLLTILACWATIRWLYPQESTNWRSIKHATLPVEPKPNASEKRAIAWLLLAIILWCTDFVHHINPAFIGLGVGLLLCLPKIGVLHGNLIKQVNLTPIVFSAGALSMGNVLLQTRALDHVGLVIKDWMAPVISSSLQSTAALYWSGFLYHFLLGNRQAMVATSLPALVNFAQLEGLNPVAVALIWTVSGGGALFIYQSAIFVAGYSYGYFDGKDLVKLGALLTIIQGILLMLLVSLYWPLIGLTWVQ